FYVQANTSSLTLQLERFSPSSKQIGPASVLEFEFNKPLAAESVHDGSIMLLHRGAFVAADIALRKGRMVRLVPRVRIADALDRSFTVRFTSELKASDGEPFAGQEIAFTDVEQPTGMPELLAVERRGGQIAVR